MSDDWMPFGWGDDRREEYQVLHDGVPPLLREPLSNWIAERLVAGRSSTPNMDNIYKLQSKIRAKLSIGSTWFRFQVASWFNNSAPDLLTLQVVDGLLSLRIELSQSALDHLEELLRSNNSKWMVGVRNDQLGLIGRVEEGVQDFTEVVLQTSGNAGTLLARAWANVHGLDKNPTSAYSDAVRAVEVAAIGVVQPRHSTATLGTVLGQMKADKDWALPLQRGPADTTSTELIRAMMRTLWEGHRDRHGNSNYSDVTLEEARVAIGLAAALVDWFSAGLIARKHTEGLNRS